MKSVRVEILNPKAERLLSDLVDKKFIAIRDTNEDTFLDVVKRIRKRAAKNPPTQEQITREVETVRSKRYAKETGQNRR